MNKNNVWYLAKDIHLNVSPDIPKDFCFGFDDRISGDIRSELVDFVIWVEANFNIPICLWVDFEYKHYLMTRSKKRAGFLFYWSDFADYPNFNNISDIPRIKLPVRTEYWTTEEILVSFIEAITCYFAWITNTHTENYSPDDETVEEILQEYLNRNN